MRKYIAFMVIFLMTMVTPSFASVGIKVDNEPLGSATDLRFDSSGTGGTNKAFNYDGSRLRFLLMLAGTGTSGAVSLGTGNTNVERGYSITYKAIGTVIETGTIANGIPGEFITIRITEVGSNGSWILTSNASTTWDSIIFNAVGETISLLWLSDSVGWVIFGDTNATFSPSSF